MKSVTAALLCMQGGSISGGNRERIGNGSEVVIGLSSSREAKDISFAHTKQNTNSCFQAKRHCGVAGGNFQGEKEALLITSDF